MQPKRPKPPTTPVEEGTTLRIEKRRRGYPPKIPGMPQAHHLSRVQLRIAAARTLLAKSIPIRTVVEGLSTQFGVSHQMAREYIAMAYQAAAADAGISDLPQRRAQLRESLEETYQAAMETGDIRTASGILRDLAKLDGAFMPDRVAIAADVVLGPENPEATRNRIAELLANPDIQAKLAALKAGGEGSSQG